MRHRISCGVIPVHVNSDGKVLFLLVQGYGGFWGFPKGHKDGNETHRETALRELGEETGITEVELFGNTMFTERYRIPKKKGTDIIKKVLYFVGTVKNTKVKRQRTELKADGWFTLDQAREKLLHNRVAMLERVVDMLNI